MEEGKEGEGGQGEARQRGKDGPAGRDGTTLNRYISLVNILCIYEAQTLSTIPMSHIESKIVDCANSRSNQEFLMHSTCGLIPFVTNDAAWRHCCAQA